MEDDSKIFSHFNPVRVFVLLLLIAEVTMWYNIIM